MMSNPHETEPMNTRIVRVPLNGRPVQTLPDDRLVYIAAGPIDRRTQEIRLESFVSQEGPQGVEMVLAQVVAADATCRDIGSLVLYGELAV